MSNAPHFVHLARTRAWFPSTLSPCQSRSHFGFRVCLLVLLCFRSASDSANRTFQSCPQSPSPPDVSPISSITKEVHWAPLAGLKPYRNHLAAAACFACFSCCVSPGGCDVRQSFVSGRVSAFFEPRH